MDELIDLIIQDFKFLKLALYETGQNHNVDMTEIIYELIKRERENYANATAQEVFDNIKIKVATLKSELELD